MAEKLMLGSLEIKRFRCFRELRIERLGRVNLIVGKNNVGKSTLLEALRLFARPGSIDDLLAMLVSRDEIIASDADAWRRDHNNPLSLDGLFFGRRVTPGENGAILIGPADSPNESLRITYEIKSDVIKIPDAKHVYVDRENDWVNMPYLLFSGRADLLTFRLGPEFQIFRMGKLALHHLPHNGDVHARWGKDVEWLRETETSSEPLRTIRFSSVGPEGLRMSDVSVLWDSVSLSPFEQDVVAAVRIISPDVERVALKAPGNLVHRVPFVKLRGYQEPVPIRALGDGVNRMFGVALALVDARSGLLVIDEIENGIHYSVQADLWRLVFEMAVRLNVQVFATTHSYDCVRAFETVVRENEEKGVLVRLAQKDDRTLVGEFDENELAIAVEGQIEVR